MDYEGELAEVIGRRARQFQRAEPWISWARTLKLTFRIPQLIAYISASTTLERGGIIATGTPEGVGVFRKPPIFLNTATLLRPRSRIWKCCAIRFNSLGHEEEPFPRFFS